MLSGAKSDLKHVEAISWKDRPALIALIGGISLGILPRLILPGLTGLLSMAIWPMSLATGLLIVGFWQARWRGKALWGLVLSGQLLAALGIGILFLDSLLH